MGDIIHKDPFKNFLSRSWWDLDDYPNLVSQKGLKIHEDDKNIYLEAVVAGIKPDDVDAQIKDGVVTIKAESTTKEEKENEYKSSSYQYYYTCALSGGEWNKANAEIRHGVIYITIPKAESAKLQKIKIKSSK